MDLTRKETKHLRRIGMLPNPRKSKGEPITIAWVPLIIGLIVFILIIFAVFKWVV